MAMNPQVAGDPSSAESARKTIQHFLGEREMDISILAEYDKSDAGMRRLLFLELWRETRQLARLPAADRRLPDCSRLRRFDELSELSDLDSYVDPYDVRDRFMREWTNEAPDSSNESTDDWDDSPPGDSWGCFDIYTTPGTPGFMAVRGGLPDGGKHLYVHRLISSQLLLYRLITVFGMPPSNEDEIDGYKSVWSYMLHWMPGQDNNGGKSYMLFSDYKGSFTFHFCGSEEASRSALDLLEWLVSDTVPHPYDGVLAGNQA
ncbi:hypothetical protein ACJ41O_010065 [Fusarium nematophilum]